MQICISLQADNHTSIPRLSFFTGRMPFLPPSQQRQSTEGTGTEGTAEINREIKEQVQKLKKVLYNNVTQTAHYKIEFQVKS